MAHGDLITGGSSDGVDKVDVTIQSYAIGSGDDVEMGHDGAGNRVIE